MKNLRRPCMLVLLLLQVQASHALHCDLVDFNIEILRCVSETMEPLTLTLSSEFSLRDQNFIKAFINFGWSLVDTFAVNNVEISNIDPEFFVNATSLSFLDLSGDKLRPALGISFNHLNNLRTLRLTDSELYAEIFQDLRKIPNLRTLIASSVRGRKSGPVNDTNYFWENLKDLQNLRILDASQNDMSDISKFEVGPGLISLNLSYCQLKLSDVHLEGAAELRFLFLSHSGVSDVPMNVFEGTRLTYLDLSFNSLTEGLSTNLNLIRLNLSHNSLNSFDMNTVPHSLEVVDLSSNNISEITTETLYRYTNLRSINLKINRLSNIENVFTYCKELLELDLSFNLIEYLENEFIFYHLTKLKKLNLSNNGIKSINYSTFHRNMDLQELLLRNNKLRTLEPWTLLGLKGLEVLDLSGNLLATLPDDLLFQSGLKVLKLSCNRLFYLSEKFFSRKYAVRLANITMHGNPWKCGCLFNIMRWATRNGVYVEPKYLVDGHHPSCFVDETNNYTSCTSAALREVDYLHWGWSPQTPVMICQA